MKYHKDNLCKYINIQKTLAFKNITSKGEFISLLKILYLDMGMLLFVFNIEVKY